jgi:hypothetical protein
LVSGNLVGLRTEPYLPRTNRVWVSFSDQYSDFDLNATVELRAFDLAGNESEPTEVLTGSTGAPGTGARGAGEGCSFGGGSRTTFGGAGVGFSGLGLLCLGVRGREAGR